MSRPDPMDKGWTTWATRERIPCPDCGAVLQELPKRGCHVGTDCTHACGSCGMHWEWCE